MLTLMQLHNHRSAVNVEKSQRGFLLSLLPALLAACIPTVEGYQQLVDGWMGATEAQLVSQWGPPDNVYQAQGRRFLTYLDESQYYVPGTAPTYTTTIIGNTAYTNTYGGSPGRYIQGSCETTFVLLSGKIVDVNFRGNDCAALPEQ